MVFSIANRSNTRKAEILNVAVQLMKEKGYRGTTLQDIAKQLNITEPALYYYYNSKEELLAEILNRIVRTAVQELQDIHKKNISVKQKIREIIHMYTKLVANNEMMTVYFNNKHELSGDNWEAVNVQEREFVRIIASILEEGMDQGVFKRMNPTAAAFALLGMSSWVYKWYDRKGALSIDEISDLFADIYLGGIIDGQNVQDERNTR
ncbi:MAG: TetR/AcrR family transcriptional regulator [Alicyclobacillaceae bacterium]|nr:TetR/AcrR family transcriptional regulator [Alicyclobacillaceae bacterium]